MSQVGIGIVSEDLRDWLEHHGPHGVILVTLSSLDLVLYKSNFDWFSFFIEPIFSNVSIPLHPIT